MSDEAAVGIHDHPELKTGLKEAQDRPALKLADIATGVVPVHPTTVDHFLKLLFGMYGNDKWGVCGPTSVGNLVRLVSAGLLGHMIVPSQADIYALYKLCNPNFDPTVEGGVEDNGVEMQDMLDKLLKHGVGDGKGGILKPLAFAKVDPKSDAELEAAVSIFGGTLWGATLETAQQGQTNSAVPKWDYKKSGLWGGHAILNGKYDAAAGDEEVISWAKDVQTTVSFRQHQLEEAWVVIWQTNVDHPAFQEGIDQAALAKAYKELTGQELHIAPSPTPTPPPSPGPTPPPPSGDADEGLWHTLQDWTTHRHVGANHAAAEAVKAWAKGKGYPA